ncbi:MAG TPA: amidohydrolase, partial [Ktedonobacterales bacterium]
MNPISRPLLLLQNGSFYTMDAASPRTSAVAVDRISGRIFAVGSTSEVRSLAGPLTETLDLRGRTVLPGFIDAHTHLLGYARARLDVDLTGTRSEADAVERVRRSAAAVPAGQWVRGRHWDVSLWPGAPFPTRASLDAAVPDHPVALWNYDFHSLWVNSAALRRAGIDSTTPDPVNGAIAREADGQPSGMLFESGAMRLVESTYDPPDAATDLVLLRGALAELRARGITAIHNIEDAYCLRLLEHLRDAGELAPRVLYYLPKDALSALFEVGFQSGFGDDALRLGGIKVFADGALSSQTAALFEPFEGQAENRGLLTTSADEMERLAAAAVDGEIGVAIHAIGDRAVHVALDAIERG